MADAANFTCNGKASPANARDTDPAQCRDGAMELAVQYLKITGDGNHERSRLGTSKG